MSEINMQLLVHNSLNTLTTSICVMNYRHQMTIIKMMTDEKE